MLLNVCLLVLRLARLASSTGLVGNATPLKHRSGGEPLATLWPISSARASGPTDSDVINYYAKRPT